MKSFADWTQELAESVGEVTHHWETRKEADIKGIDLNFDWGAAEEHDAIAPNWQNPGSASIPPPFSPPVIPQAAHPLFVAYAECNNCRKIAYLYEHDVYGKKYHVCNNCMHVLTGGTP